ncbi:hypothetical protein ACFWRZ_24810 [Streptomyces rubiginosohelvolus]|uniref:hypothetical protein n=1 Tax=Streptomyces rubiginosohelvolus TaxID=67362 RepID=UPI00365F337F
MARGRAQATAWGPDRQLRPDRSSTSHGVGTNAVAVPHALAHVRRPAIADLLAESLSWNPDRVSDAIERARAHPHLAGPYRCGVRPPPKGDNHRLEGPVGLTTPDVPDTVVGRIAAFDYRMGSR